MSDQEAYHHLVFMARCWAVVWLKFPPRRDEDKGVLIRESTLYVVM